LAYFFFPPYTKNIILITAIVNIIESNRSKSVLIVIPSVKATTIHIIIAMTSIMGKTIFNTRSRGVSPDGIGAGGTYVSVV
jgi:hypothetical protein